MLKKIVLFTVILFSLSFSQFSMIMVNQPYPGLQIQSGTFSSMTEIHWKYMVDIDSVIIELSVDSGITWNRITKSAPCYYGSYEWLVPLFKTNYDKSMIRVTSIDSGTSYSGLSEGNFTILAGEDDTCEPNSIKQESYRVYDGDTITNAVIFGDSERGGNSNRMIPTSEDKDWYVFYIESGQTLTVKTTPAIEMSEGNAYGNVNESPIINLFTKTKSLFSFEGLTYTANEDDSLYICINSTGDWCKYNLTFDLLKVENVEKIILDSSSYTASIDSTTKDTTYFAEVISEKHNINVKMDFDEKIEGSIETAEVPHNMIENKPDSLNPIKVISIEPSIEISNTMKTAEIIIPYEGYEVGDFDINKIDVLWYNETLREWETVNFNIDTDNKVVVAHTTHFSVYGLFIRDEGTGSVKTLTSINQNSVMSINKQTTCIRINSKIKNGILSLYDLSGRNIEKRILNSNENLISISDLANGTYIASLNVGNEKYFRQFTICK